MDRGPLGKRCKAKAPRGEHYVLLDSYCTHQETTGDAYRVPPNAWRAKERVLSLASDAPPISTRRKPCGWMRGVMWAGGKSLTTTSLTPMGHREYQVLGRARHPTRRAHRSHAQPTLSPDTTHEGFVPA